MTHAPLPPGVQGNVQVASGGREDGCFRQHRRAGNASRDALQHDALLLPLLLPPPPLLLLLLLLPLLLPPPPPLLLLLLLLPASVVTAVRAQVLLQVAHEANLCALLKHDSIVEFLGDAPHPLPTKACALWF